MQKSYNSIRKDVMVTIMKINYFAMIGSLTYLNGIEHISAELTSLYSLGMSILSKAQYFSDKDVDENTFNKYKFFLEETKKFLYMIEFAFCDNGGEELYNQVVSESEKAIKSIGEVEVKPIDEPKSIREDEEW
jgi:hypothetical protein